MSKRLAHNVVRDPTNGKLPRHHELDCALDGLAMRIFAVHEREHSPRSLHDLRLLVLDVAVFLA